jgi:hypothetical protein
MTEMTVSVPVGTSSTEVIREVLDDLRDRLSDQYGYEATGETSPTARGLNHAMSRNANVEVIDHDGTVTFKLHGFVDVDAHDLFTGVSSGIEQRHVGTRVEIG